MDGDYIRDLKNGTIPASRSARKSFLYGIWESSGGVVPIDVQCNEK
jgi:hypothetical protein